MIYLFFYWWYLHEHAPRELVVSISPRVHSCALQEELCEWVSGKRMNEWLQVTEWTAKRRRSSLPSLSMAFPLIHSRALLSIQPPPSPHAPTQYYLRCGGKYAARALTQHGKQTHTVHARVSACVCACVCVSGEGSINSTMALLPLTSFR